MDNILKSELAGQEAGMMKCLFIVETRALTCKALYTQSFDQLTDFLVDNEIQIGSVDDETRQARLKFHFVLFLIIMFFKTKNGSVKARAYLIIHYQSFTNSVR